MKILCKTGLELLDAYQSEEDKQAIFVKMKGVSRLDELSGDEIKELADLSEAFNLSVLTPKDATGVCLQFPIQPSCGERLVVLGKFGELDLTLNALELLEDFNPTKVDRIPMFIGCLYAGTIKAAFNLAEDEAKVAWMLSEAIKENCEFEDVYAVYDFFVFWKETSTNRLTPSMRHLKKLYRFQRRKNKPIEMILRKSLMVSRMRSGRPMRAFKNLVFIAGISIALIVRCYCIMTESLQKS